MKKITHTLLLFLLSTCLGYSQAFITTWKTDNTGPSNDNQITIPTTGTGYNYDITWGDGNSDTGVTGNITHTYASAGTYTVSITGAFPNIYFNFGGDKEKILTVEQWGDNNWQLMTGAFFGCKNLTITASDAPDLSSVTSLLSTFRNCSSLTGGVANWDVENISYFNNMFYGASSFNEDIGNWNTDNAISMNGMFGYCTVFNQDIGGWNTDNVIDMRSMFFEARNFNQDISNWNTDKLEYMNGIFSSAYAFNQDISGWNTTKITDMSNVFYQALAFNQDISNWNTTNVTTMRTMFFGCPFNQDISGWDVGKVTDMDYMFNYSSIDQDLSNWDVSMVTTMVDMFDFSSLSATNYDNILIGWSQLTLQNDVAFGTEGLQYCDGSTARQSIIDNFNWTIADDTKYCVVNIPDANFKAALLANVSINTTDDGEISYDEAEAFTGTIAVGDGTIADLTGIEAFINITTLNCYNNQLTSLDLSNNTELVNINCSNNLLTSLNVNGLDKLDNFYFAKNLITTIDISDNIALTQLGANENQLTTLDVSNNSNLVDIGAYENQLTSLDVSSSPDLLYLEVYDNQLSTLDISSNTLLVGLAFDNNELTSLNIANGNNTNFEFFVADGNPNLTCITVDDVAYAEANFTDIDETASFSTNCSNTGNDILTFSFSEQADAAVIDASNHTIVIEVVFGTDFSSLTPTFEVSNGAFSDPVSGVTQDFSSAFIYTVTAENPTAIQEWTVNVIFENSAPTDLVLDNTSIDENNDINDIIGLLSTTDVDATDTHTYSLVSGTGDTDNASFGISGSNLIALESFDFETKTSYSIRVQTFDGRDGTFEKEFTIAITDVNEQQSQIITFNVIADQFFEAGSVTLSATASSGLSVTFDLVSGPGTLAGNVVTFTDLGTVVVSANQVGDSDFFAAASVEQSFDIITVTGFEDEASALIIYPNPAKDVLTIQTQQEGMSIRLVNISGSEVMEIRPNVSNSISHLDKGIYFLLISNSKGVTIHKIIKQ